MAGSRLRRAGAATATAPNTKKSARREFLKKTRMGELSQLVGRSTLLSVHLGMTLAGVLLGYLLKSLLGLGALALEERKRLDASRASARIGARCTGARRSSASWR